MKTKSIFNITARALSLALALAMTLSVTACPTGGGGSRGGGTVAKNHPRFAYVANAGSDNVTIYRIDSTTGALTEVGTEVAAGTQPYSVTVMAGI